MARVLLVPLLLSFLFFLFFLGGGRGRGRWVCVTTTIETPKSCSIELCRELSFFSSFFSFFFSRRHERRIDVFIADAKSRALLLYRGRRRRRSRHRFLFCFRRKKTEARTFFDLPFFSLKPRRNELPSGCALLPLPRSPVAPPPRRRRHSEPSAAPSIALGVPPSLSGGPRRRGNRSPSLSFNLLSSLLSLLLPLTAPTPSSPAPGRSSRH